MIINYTSMKQNKSGKKVSIFRKLLVKVCRIFGYELVGQSNLEFPSSNRNYENGISLPGVKSFTLGLGSTKITRKIECLDVIVKTCTSVQLVTQNKKRIFEKNKSEYTFRSINSLYNSASELKKNYSSIKIKFTFIDGGSNKDDLEKIKSLNNNHKFETSYISIDPINAKNSSHTINKNNKDIETNMAMTMSSIKESFILGKDCEDLIYFVEDDYIHKIGALTEMVLSYEKFSSIIKEELFLLSTDYPYLYKKAENTNIVVGEKYHWRTVKESLLTFMTSKKMIRKYYKELILMATHENNPFEKNLHKIFEKELCFSPIPSLSIHCTNVNSVFGISPNIDIKKIWDQNN
tara:strand:- start:476 stop:1522 length:1047 start_codon:yes stop_codon:yes gene_type:complete